MNILEVAVQLESDEYGSEEFTYPSIDEAMDAIRRLLEASLTKYQQDGIERKISVHIRPME